MFTAVAAMLLWISAVPAPGQNPRESDAAPSSDPTMADGLRALRDADVRVATIAFRLATANLDLCQDVAANAGVVLHDADQYSQAARDEARDVFGLGEWPGVSGVVSEGPADKAGIRADDALIAINGEPTVPRSPTAKVRESRRGDYAQMGRLLTRLQTALAQGPVEIELLRDGRRITTTLAPVMACASAIQLMPSKKLHGGADGQMISITTALVDFAQNDDELAIIIAHEMAHNALRHRASLDEQKVSRGLLSIFGANARKIRDTECAADHIGLFLAARAGYAIEVAPNFWRRFGRTYDFGPFSDPTHPSGKERARAADATIAQIEELRTRGAPVMPTADCP